MRHDSCKMQEVIRPIRYDQVGVGKPDWDNGQEFKKLVPRLNLVNRNFECPFLVYFEDF